MIVLCLRLATAFSIVLRAVALLGLASGPSSLITWLLIGIWIAIDTQRKKMLKEASFPMYFLSGVS